MKKAILSFIMLLLCVPVALWAMQEVPAGRVEITGTNTADLPEVIITANVFDPVSQPILGLTESDFELVGELAGRARITNVQNISDDELPFSVVLVIDVSSSMGGQPIDRAKEAAQLFVESIGANDSVAVYTFSGNFTLLQEYTTDKDVLGAAIESITVGGTTGLYQAAYNSIALAAVAPNTRRAVILLSDGAEYGGASVVGRGAALAEAQRLGVPVYTIGLGYGIDRTYLQQLSGGTNTRFYESPNPEQLTQIYADLAALLTSQYIITLNVDVPGDGTEYSLGLQATTPFGSVGHSATVRAPIPVPIVTAPVLSVPLLDVTDITPAFAADDDIVSASYSIDDGEATELNEAPFRFSIDPETLLPGEHRLTVTVTDITGDTGTVTAPFEVGVLPPRVNVVSNLNQTVENLQTVQVEIGGQTAGTRATFQIDGGRVMTDAEAPFAFDVDPRELAPGTHTLTIVAGNEGGASSTVEVPFSVATLAPDVRVGGIEEGAVVNAVTPIEVNVVVTQSPITDIEILVNGRALDNREIPSEGIVLSTASLDPIMFAPGPATLTVRATNSSGGVSVNEIDFNIAALPPIVVFENLADGDQLSADQDAVITFVSQTPVRQVEYLLDGEALPTQTSAPWDIPLDVLALGPGEHTLTVTATTANGQTTTAGVTFGVTEAPGLTATASVPTATPTPTINVPATLTVEARITESAQGTIAANTQVAADATSTERSFMATGTAVARVTGTAVAAAEIAAQATAATATQAAIQATRTEVANVTAQARAQAQDATATAEFGIQATQTATEATATSVARQTSTAEAQQQATVAAQSAATSTVEAQARASQTSVAIAVAATATRIADIAATQTATEATATTVALQTSTAEAQQQATLAAERAATERADAQATQTATEATATTVALQTSTAQAQQQAASTAERLATERAAEQATQAATEATATTVARQTVTAEARQQATATQNARLEATQTAVAADLATATQSALVVAQAATATNDFRATATEVARLALTETAEAARATQTAEARLALTETAAAARVTQDARATQTAEARLSLTETAAAAQETVAARMTQTAGAQLALTETAAAAQETAAARMTQTAEARQATQDARTTETTEARQATQDARMTETAEAQQVTRAAQLAATATQDAAERAEALTATASSRQTATAEAIGLTATRSLQTTATAQTAFNVQATSDAGATESSDATQAAATQSAHATSEAASVLAATQDAQATGAAIETATASVTEEPTTTPTEEPTVPATPTPRGTLVPVEAESQSADVNQLVPILVVIVAAVIVLIVIYLILRGGRGRR